MKKAIFLLLVLALVAGFAFANGDDEAAASAAPMTDVVEEAALAYFSDYPEGGYIIKEDVFLDKVKAGGDMFVIDIRQADVYAESHITGAVNIPWGPELASKLNLIPQSGEIYLYCYTGQTAGQTVAVLNAAGIPVKSVRYGFNRGISTVDGYEAAIDAEGVAMAQIAHDIDPAMQAAADAYFGDFGAAPFKNNIIASSDAAAILAAGDDSVQFVDIRKAEDFAKGHIDGAMSMPFKAGMQVSFSDLPSDKKLIVNCYSGQTAGQTVGVLRLLGYDAVSLKHGMGTGKTGDTGWANEGFDLVM
jgi:rhodanese-related sulfurtransferase